MFSSRFLIKLIERPEMQWLVGLGDDLPRFESERVTFKVKSRVFEYSRGPAQSYFMLEPIKKSSLYFKEEDQRDINSYYHQKFKHESIYLTNLSICF